MPMARPPARSLRFFFFWRMQRQAIRRAVPQRIRIEEMTMPATAPAEREEERLGLVAGVVLPGSEGFEVSSEGVDALVEIEEVDVV